MWCMLAGSWFLRSWLVFLFCFFFLPWVSYIVFCRELNPFLGTFWRAWMLFILVGRPLQNLFWSLSDLFVMIPICYDHIAFWSFGYFSLVLFYFQFLLIFYSFVCILFFNGHTLSNVFLLSHWLLCTEKNKVNYVIVLLFLPHFCKEARKHLTGISICLNIQLAI